MTFFYRCVRAFFKAFFLIFHRHRVYGLENAIKGRALICANHASFLDPPILCISWPRNLHFLGRKPLFDIPLFNTIIRKMNAHPIQGIEHNLLTIKLVSRLLKKEDQIAVFPEGERSWRGELLDMKHGFGMIVMREKCLCIPTYIDGAFEALPRGKKLPRLFTKTACVFGSPISWEEFSHLPKKEAQKALSERVKKEIASLKQWYREGHVGSPP